MWYDVSFNTHVTTTTTPIRRLTFNTLSPAPYTKLTLPIRCVCHVHCVHHHTHAHITIQRIARQPKYSPSSSSHHYLIVVGGNAGGPQQQKCTAHIYNYCAHLYTSYAHLYCGYMYPISSFPDVYRKEKKKHKRTTLVYVILLFILC